MTTTNNPTAKQHEYMLSLFKRMVVLQKHANILIVDLVLTLLIFGFYNIHMSIWKLCTFENFIKYIII
jgi:hypothetical protein